MKKYILLLMAVCGSKIRKILHITPTPSKSSTVEQGKSSTLKAVQELPLKKAKSRTYARKKSTIKRLPKCPVMNKTSYNEQIAKREAERMSDRLTKLRAYHCEFCPHWHLTHKKDKLKR